MTALRGWATRDEMHGAGGAAADALALPAVLPSGLSRRARGENFPVALRIIPARSRRALLALYAFARYVDDLGDEFDGPRIAVLHDVADQVRLLYEGGRPGVSVVSGISILRDDYGVPAEPFLDLVEANIVDQRRSRYATISELLAYCRLSANPVGRVVLRIFGVGSDSLNVLSDQICTGLQLVEHVQDIGQDYRAGRVYMPRQDLERFGVEEGALGLPRAGESLRALVRFETDRALDFLNSGAPILGALRGWGRVAVAGYLAGGRAAAATIRAADYDVLARQCSPSKWRVTAESCLAIARMAR